MKLRIFSIIAFLFLATVVCFGQTEQGSHTLFRSDPAGQRVNAYVSFDGSLYYVNETLAGGLGGTIGMTVNRSFSAGLTGSFLIKSEGEEVPPFTPPPGINNYQVRRYCWYAGVLVEPTLLPTLPLHLTFPITIGGGLLTYKWQEDNGWWSYYSTTLPGYPEYFFIAIVGARAEINAVDGFRISVGPSYRYVTNVDFLNGFALDLSLKLGRY